VALSPDGKTAATRGGDMVIRLWDLASGKELQQIIEMPDAGSMFFAMNGYGLLSTRLTFTPDGSAIAVLPLDGNLIELNTGRQTALDATIRMWDVSTGKLLRRFDTPKNKPATLAIARDGRALATGNADGSVSLWEVASGKERFSFKTGSAGVLASLTFSPDGKTLTGAGQGQTVGVWDALSGQEQAQLKGHQGAVVSLAYAADGKTLVSGSSDTTVLVWDVAIRADRKPPAAELSAAQLDSLWAELAGADARKAYDAFRTLSAGPKQTATLLRERVKPVEAPDPKRVAALLVELESDVFITRKRAVDALEHLGELIEPDLKRVLAGGPSLETRQRVERVLEKLATGQAPPPDVLQALRAVEVLEQAGGPEAREVLQTLSQGAAGAKLTKQAKASLERLGGS
jgi:hypothetical protein